MNLSLFGQNSSKNNTLSERLETIDQKMIIWENEEATELLRELESKKENLSIEDQYAIELRRFQFEYYVNNNEENFNTVLNRVDQIKTMNTPQLEYDYLSFIAQVYKTSFDFENAIKYHKTALVNAEKRGDTSDAIYTYWSLGSSYFLIEYVEKPEFYKNQLDSALYFYNQALKFSETPKTIRILPRIYNNLGRIETAKNNLSQAKKYISKALEQHENAKDSFGISISLNNLSKIFLEEKNYKKSIDHANKSNRYIKDKSLRIKKNNLEYIAISNYNIGNLNDAYRAMKNTLETSEDLTNNTFLKNIKKVELKYKLAKEQQKTLQEKNKRLRLQLLLYVTGFSIIILSIIGYIFYSRNQRYKKRFDELMEENKPLTNKSSSIDLTLNTVNSILEGLERFEREKIFLEKDINLKDLAKKLKTNSSYLSKVVNTYKNKNFNTYLNELRIQYTIQELTNKEGLRLYTIEAIADTMGYNNGESFASAFRKITGIYPSYFIKQLQKQ